MVLFTLTAVNPIISQENIFRAVNSYGFLKLNVTRYV